MLRTPIALLASALVAACQVPNFKGPQVQDPPPAFSMNREATQERRMFPARAVVYHDAWVEASWGNFSGIYINGHPGRLGKGEVEAAQRQAMADAAGQRVEFGALEPLDVDGRTAWGWGETWRLENNGLQYVVFRAAIPYDTVTYAVEFLTGDPGLKIRPDSLRTVVASFAVGRTEWNLPLVLIGAGVGVLLLGVGRSRANARAARARHVPLVKIPPKQAEGEGKPGAPPAQAGPSSTEAGPSSSPAGTSSAAAAPSSPPSETSPPPSIAEAVRTSLEGNKPDPGQQG